MRIILEHIRAKVIAAVPEIVVSCYFCEGVGTFQPSSKGNDCCPPRQKCGYCDGTGKVIGRPITLADVLRAICPIFIFWNIRKEVVELLKIWNLALPLDEQEPEVIAFLAKILNGDK